MDDDTRMQLIAAEDLAMLRLMEQEALERKRKAVEATLRSRAKRRDQYNRERKITATKLKLFQEEAIAYYRKHLAEGIGERCPHDPKWAPKVNRETEHAKREAFSIVLHAWYENLVASGAVYRLDEDPKRNT